jgi:hypothetical protein
VLNKLGKICSYVWAEAMRRRDFITVIGIAVLLWPVGLQAQEAGRAYRIGFLSAGPRSAPYWLEVFDDLRQAGFVEGQNLTVDWHQYGSHVDLISQFAAEVVKAKVDVVVATGDTAIRALQQATTTIPILGSTDDMIGSGLVKSLARPDGNTLTGYLSISRCSRGRWLSRLRTACHSNVQGISRSYANQALAGHQAY